MKSMELYNYSDPEFKYKLQPLNPTKAERMRRGAKVLAGFAIILILICTTVFLITKKEEVKHQSVKTQI